MGELQEKIPESKNEEYRDFLHFVELALIFRIAPLFEGFTNNTVFKILIGLTVIAIFMKKVPITKLSFYLQAKCERFKINLFYLYVIYIALHFWVFYVLFEPWQ